jgi:hypothetical protein
MLQNKLRKKNQSEIHKIILKKYSELLLFEICKQNFVFCISISNV